MIHAAVPGERWEIEFCPDEPPQIEVFRPTGDIHGPSKLAELFERFSD